MKKHALHSIFAIAALTIATACSAADAPAKVSDGVFVDGKGMTLYIFDKDATPGKSACNGGCATNWPPLFSDDAATAAGDWSIVTRDDGKKQWAFKGKPLYLWAKDAKPGDKTGDGAGGGTWHVAKP